MAATRIHIKMPTPKHAVIDPRTVRPDLTPDLAEFLIKACAPANADRFSHGC